MTCLLRVTATLTDGNAERREAEHPSADDNENGNLLVAQDAVLDPSATIQSLSFYVTNTAGKLRLGVYSDVSGTPGES